MNIFSENDCVRRNPFPSSLLAVCPFQQFGKLLTVFTTMANCALSCVYSDFSAISRRSSTAVLRRPATRTSRASIRHCPVRLHPARLHPAPGTLPAPRIYTLSSLTVLLDGLLLRASHTQYTRGTNQIKGKKLGKDKPTSHTGHDVNLISE